jgi:hypothetical protein
VGCSLWDNMKQGSQFKAAGNRASSEWGCNWGQRGGWWMGWGVEGNAVCTRAAGGWAQVHPRTHTAFAAAVSRGGWSCGIGGGIRGWGRGVN